MEELLRPEEKVGGSSPFRGTTESPRIPHKHADLIPMSDVTANIRLGLYVCTYVCTCSDGEIWMSTGSGCWLLSANRGLPSEVEWRRSAKLIHAELVDNLRGAIMA